MTLTKSLLGGIAAGFLASTQPAQAADENKDKAPIENSEIPAEPQPLVDLNAPPKFDDLPGKLPVKGEFKIGYQTKTAMRGLAIDRPAIAATLLAEYKNLGFSDKRFFSRYFNTFKDEETGQSTTSAGIDVWHDSALYYIVPIKKFRANIGFSGIGQGGSSFETLEAYAAIRAEGTLRPGLKIVHILSGSDTGRGTLAEISIEKDIDLGIAALSAEALLRYNGGYGRDARGLSNLEVRASLPIRMTKQISIVPIATFSKALAPEYQDLACYGINTQVSF